MAELAKLCLMIVDCEHKTAPKSNEGYPLIRTTDIGRGRLKLSNVQRVNADTYEEWTRRAVPQPGDLILAREAPVGNVALVTPGLEPVLGQRTVLIRPDPDVVDADYLTYRLLADDIQHWVKGVANGSTVPHLNMEDIRELPMPELPPLTQQRRVGAALAAFDDLTENNLRRIDVLEEMARLMYSEWFVHLRFPGHEKLEFIDSELGQIPQSWSIETTSDLIARDVLEIGDGYRAKNSEFAGEGFAFVRVKNVREGYLDLATADHLPESYGRRVGGKTARSGDCVISMKGTVGRMAFVSDRTPPLVYSPQVSYWRSLKHEVISPEYLRLWMQSPAFVEQCAKVKGATDMADYVNLRDQRSMKLVVPSAAVHAAFVEAVSPLLLLSDNLRSQIEVLAAARDLLLPRLVSGELDVSEIDLDLESVA